MKHRFLSACLAAAMALTASVPAVSAAENTGLSVQTVSSAPLAQASYDEASVYNAMIALKDKYPDGMKWTNDDFYAWNGGYYSGGYGCAAFAFILSDAAFGDLPARRYTSFDASSVRVGDILRNDRHSYIVLEVHEDYFTIAEGNINESILWGREIGFDGVTYNFEEHLTRYPEEEEPTETTTEPITTETTETTEDIEDAEFYVSLEITSTPDKFQYVLGEELDLSGLRFNTWHTEYGVWVPTLTDMTVEDYPTTEEDYIEISNYDPYMLGAQSVLVTLYKYNNVLQEWVTSIGTFPVIVYEKDPDAPSVVSRSYDIEIVSYPDKMHYAPGEAFDPTGLVVNASITTNYSDGTEEYSHMYDVSHDELMFSEIDSSGLVTVSYIFEDNPDLLATYTFNVTIETPEETTAATTTTETTTTTTITETTVTEPIASDAGFEARMEIVTQPVKTLYALESMLDLTGLKVNVWHSYFGEWILIHDAVNPLDYPEEFTISGFDSTAVGEQEITVTYGTFNDVLNEDVRTSESFTVELIDLMAEENQSIRYVEEMTIQTLPDKLEYTIGEPLDLTGINVSAFRIYSNRMYVLPASADLMDGTGDFQVIGYDPFAEGEQEVIIIYQTFNSDTNEDVRCAASFRVNVKAAEEGTLGDINRDGSVNAADAAMLLTAAAKAGSGNDSGLSAEQEQDADVNGSGSFDAADAALILSYAAYCGTGGTMTLPEYLESLSETME